MPRSASFMMLPLLALSALAQAAPQLVDDSQSARAARELVLPEKELIPAAPRLKQDDSLWGGSLHLGGVILDLRSALTRVDQERGNHYEYGLRLPLLADQVTRLTMFATGHYTAPSAEREAPRLVPLTEQSLAQSRANGFVTPQPQAGRSSVSVGVSAQHKVNRDWGLDGSIGAFQLGSAPSTKTPAKVKVQPFMRGTATLAF